MAAPLNAEEAYMACLEDMQVAQSCAKYAVEQGIVPDEDYPIVLRREFTRLWVARVESGELAPLDTNTYPLQKAS